MCRMPGYRCNNYCYRLHIFTDCLPSQASPDSCVRLARWDPNNVQHVAVVDAGGTLTSIRATASGGSLRMRFQLKNFEAGA